MHKGMTLAEMAREIHENAKAHGWWDEEREAAEVYALIHSEWSEALEEYRAGRPDRWYFCFENEDGICGSGSCDCQDYQANNAEHCPDRGSKPEGVCVELIDGVIRILDYIAHCGKAVGYRDDNAGRCLEGQDELPDITIESIRKESLPSMVNALHMQVARAFSICEIGDDTVPLLLSAMIACAWIKGRGLDPEELLIEKHEYNVTRPYKHGKVC